MIVHIVEMLRWGDTETHHYIVGAYESKELAVEVGEAEVSWRGGKYEYQIVEREIGDFSKEVMEYHKGCI